MPQTTSAPTDHDELLKLLQQREVELEKAKEHVQAIDKMKSDFVSVATHQLRTPLSALKWTMSMLLRGDMGPLTDGQKILLTKALESNERMIALLQDLLLADQIGSGKLRTMTSPSFIPTTVVNLLLELRPIAQQRGIEISFLDPDNVKRSVKIDPQYIHAILQNLIENAIKYSRPQSTITVTLKEEGDMQILSVADSGIGIPSEQQDKIFQRFYRASNAVKVQQDGSGLGLFIIKHIIEENKGKIWFESVENTGTTFFVQLPVHT